MRNIFTRIARVMGSLFRYTGECIWANKREDLFLSSHWRRAVVNPRSIGTISEKVRMAVELEGVNPSEEGHSTEG